MRNGMQSPAWSLLGQPYILLQNLSHKMEIDRLSSLVLSEIEQEPCNEIKDAANGISPDRQNRRLIFGLPAGRVHVRQHHTTL